LYVGERVRRELGVVQVTRSDKIERVKIVHLSIYMVENERQEVRISVDLELEIRSKGEVGGEAAKFCWDGVIKPACRRHYRSRPVDGEARHTRNNEGKSDTNAAKEVV
jgi:hypothetical protein